MFDCSEYIDTRTGNTFDSCLSAGKGLPWPIEVKVASLPPMVTAPEVERLLAAGCPVAIGVSGGKDSAVTAFATQTYLNEIGHTGPRLLIHSDLGRVEWPQSLPLCQLLAERTGMELAVVRRQAGDLMDRWLARWENNVYRYANLELVTLPMPFSSKKLRFCTSELKVDVICRALTQRFPGQGILSVSGIRREESTERAKAPVCKAQPKLERKRLQTYGYDWHPILNWTLGDVLASHKLYDFPLHEAYVVYGSTRVSCCYCILASLGDLCAGARNPENHAIYREIVGLEITSTFSFKSNQWLGDVAPHLLSEEMRAELAGAKERAARRQAAEALIPGYLLYTDGWPTVMPTWSEAALLAEVRARVAEAVGISIGYATAEAVMGRYEELMAAKAMKG